VTSAQQDYCNCCSCCCRKSKLTLWSSNVGRWTEHDEFSRYLRLYRHQLTTQLVEMMFSSEGWQIALATSAETFRHKTDTVKLLLNGESSIEDFRQGQMPKSITPVSPKQVRNKLTRDKVRCACCGICRFPNSKALQRLVASWQLPVYRKVTGKHG